VSMILVIDLKCLLNGRIFERLFNFLSWMCIFESYIYRWFKVSLKSNKKYLKWWTTKNVINYIFEFISLLTHNLHLPQSALTKSMLQAQKCGGVKSVNRIICLGYL
jgi:hypothetical protein